MKKTILLGLILAGSFAVQSANACITPISARSLFAIHMAGVEILEAKTGDHIVMEVILPLVPSTMKSKTEATFNEKVLRLVAAVPARPLSHQMGVSIKRYYLEVIGAGETTVKLETRDAGGKLLREQSQKVEATVRPVPKCM